IVAGDTGGEVVAALAPSWAPLRHTARGRARLVAAAAMGSLVLALLRGASVASALHRTQAIVHPGPRSWLMLVVTILGASALAWIVLRRTDEKGLGSSLTLLLGLVGLLGFLRQQARLAMTGDTAAGLPQPWTALLLCALAAMATVMVLAVPPREP